MKTASNVSQCVAGPSAGQQHTLLPPAAQQRLEEAARRARLFKGLARVAEIEEAIRAVRAACPERFRWK